MSEDYLEALVDAGVLLWDGEQKSYLVRNYEEHGFAVWIMPMIYNDRIIIGELHAPTYDHGWCYDKGPVVVAAALNWDPLTQDEPQGYKKRATLGVRRAPNREDRS